MKVLVATEKPFAAVAVNGIKEVLDAAGIEMVLLEKYPDKAALLKAVEDVEGLIVRSDIVDAEVLAAAKNLKIVVRAGAGYDNIDLNAATEKGVCVMNTPGQNSNAVAELVFGMTVLMIRNHYNGTSGTELKGKTLGIHAYGQVGRNVARIASGTQCGTHSQWIRHGNLFIRPLLSHRGDGKGRRKTRCFGRGSLPHLPIRFAAYPGYCRDKTVDQPCLAVDHAQRRRPHQHRP